MISYNRILAGTNGENVSEDWSHVSYLKKKSKFVLRQLERKRNGNVYVYIFFQVLQYKE